MLLSMPSLTLLITIGPHLQCLLFYQLPNAHIEFMWLIALLKYSIYLSIDYNSDDPSILLITILAKNRGTISDFLCNISRLPPSPPFKVDVAF